MAEVVIMGGGPAGTSAAIALARAGVTVVVLERSHYETDRLGETLTQAAAIALDRLGVHPASFPHVKSAGSLSLWNTPEPVATELLFTPAGDGVHVDRQSLNKALAQRARIAGAEVHTGTRVTSCCRVGNRWQLQAAERTYSARYVIDATGGRAGVGALHHRLDRQVAFAARLFNIDHRDSRLYIEAVQDGWWYFAPLPNQQGLVVHLTDVDLLPNGTSERLRHWYQELAATSLIAPRVKGASVASHRIVVAGMRLATALGGEEWVAVGDSVLKPDPLSGSGVAFALNSGWFAGIVVGQALSGNLTGLEQYQLNMEAQAMRYLSERVAAYSSVRHWPTSVFWNRRTVGSNSLMK